MFKEFTEFPNPESADYDLTSAQGSPSEPTSENPYLIEIIDMVGFLEDGEWVNYGISESEYLNPTQETVDKIRKQLAKKNIEPLTGMKK